MANVYIRDGGSGDGSAWNNALDVLPATLTRGNTYYVADGTYPSYVFDDSGTTAITIKKATESDHGTETGWLSTYGDGEAVFARATISADTIILDGLVFDGDVEDWEQDGLIHLLSGADDCQILNCTLRLGCTSLLPDNEAYNIGIRLEDSDNTLISNTTIDGEQKSSFFLRDTGMIQLNGTNNTVQNCTFKNGWDIDVFKTFGGFHIKDCIIRDFDNPKYDTHEHMDFIQAYMGSASAGILERCIVWNFDGQLGNFDFYDSGNTYSFIIRNNVFAIVGGACFQGHPNFEWYNNVFYKCATFYDLGAIHLLNYLSGDNDHRYFGTIIKNNIFLECGQDGDQSISFDGSDSTTISYNYFGGASYSAIGGQGSNFINGGDVKFINPSLPFGANTVPFTSDDGFNIQAGSVVIGMGTNVSITTDILGNSFTIPPSMGPYEFIQATIPEILQSLGSIGHSSSLYV